MRLVFVICLSPIMMAACGPESCRKEIKITESTKKKATCRDVIERSYICRRELGIVIAKMESTATGSQRSKDQVIAGLVDGYQSGESLDLCNAIQKKGNDTDSMMYEKVIGCMRMKLCSNFASCYIKAIRGTSNETKVTVVR